MRERPLLIASFGFTFGVLYGPADLPWVDLIAGLFCVAIARRRQFRFRIMHSIFLWTGAFLLGLPVGSFLLPGAETLDAPATVSIEGDVVEAADRGLLADGLIIDVTSPARARILLRVPHPDGAEHPPACAAPGGRIRVLARVSPRRPSLVPAFRSRRLAVRRGVQLYAEAIGPCTAIDPGSSARTFLSGALAGAISSAAPKHAGILSALATGDRTGAELSAETKIMHAGLGHLLELSGLTMALLFFAALHLLRRNPRLRSRLAAPLLILLILLFGATPSAIRIALVLACLLLPSLGRSRLDVLDALALAVIVVLAISPAALGDIRFQLAFAGVSAALRLYPALAEKIPRLGLLPRTARAPIHLLLLALAVTLGTAPLAARLFDRVSMTSFALAPLALIVMIGVIGPLSIAGGALALIAPVAGAPFLALASTLLDAILRILPSGDAASIPTPTVLECVLFYAIISAIAAPKLDRARFLTRSRFAAIAAVALVASIGFGLWRRSIDRFEVTLLPASRGVAAVIELPDGHVLVRDTAAPAAWFQMEQRMVSNHLKLRRHTGIDVLLAGEGDDPATAGELAHQFPIGRVWRTTDPPLELGGTRIARTQDGLRFDTGGRSILFASTSSAADTDAAILPDGTVIAGGATLHPGTHGMIRIRIEDDRVEAIPLRSEVHP